MSTWLWSASLAWCTLNAWRISRPWFADAEYLTTKEAAKLLGYETQYTACVMREAGLKPVRKGSENFWWKTDVEFLKKSTQGR